MVEVKMGGKVGMDSEGNKTAYDNEVRYNKAEKRVEYIDENEKWHDANTLGGGWFGSDPRSVAVENDMNAISGVGQEKWINEMEKKFGED